MSGFDLSQFLPYRLAVAAARVSREFGDRYRAEFGLSIAEWRVLAHLSQAQAVSVGEITARVDMEKSRVSRAAQRLEDAGLVLKTAHPGDGRLVALSLTPQGAALMDRLGPMALEFQTELESRLGLSAGAFNMALTQLEGDR
jgi:DNA-binding MarR family transcriptional regulator